ncbi:MAG: hypothetical protein M2R45_01321 [Verrucomicrobia subdivision 3 bacterium]|nr:hypothetical protein [Limisphaerales bacterium]MCS1415187.1 hypothetical protein [Limisphaerales bacterium]
MLTALDQWDTGIPLSLYLYACLGSPRSSPHRSTGCVVLMDIQMPRMTSIECVQQLRTYLPDLKVLILTI